MLIDKFRLAQALSISRPTLDAWQKKGWLPKTHKSTEDRRLVMFDVAEVVDAARKHNLNASLGVLCELLEEEQATTIVSTPLEEHSK